MPGLLILMGVLGIFLKRPYSVDGVPVNKIQTTRRKLSGLRDWNTGIKKTLPVFATRPRRWKGILQARVRMCLGWAGGSWVSQSSKHWVNEEYLLGVDTDPYDSDIRYSFEEGYDDEDD
jgi:hypothetical protein